MHRHPISRSSGGDYSFQEETPAVDAGVQVATTSLDGFPATMLVLTEALVESVLRQASA